MHSYRTSTSIAFAVTDQRKTTLFNFVTGLIAGACALFYHIAYQSYGRAMDTEIYTWNVAEAETVYDPRYGFEATILAWGCTALATILLAAALRNAVLAYRVRRLEVLL
jgi:hypothetical protein